MLNWPMLTTRTGIGIFFAEEGHRAELFGLFQSQDARRHGRPFRDAGVDLVLDLEDFLRRQGPLVGEVEAELVLLDLRSALRRRFAQRLSQGVVQQVRGRVGAANGAAAFGVDFRRELLADLQPALLQMADVQNQRAVALRVDHLEPAAFGGERSRVADLAPRLAIKRRAVEDHGHRRGAAEFFELIDELFFGDDADDFSLGLDGVIAQEFRRAGRFADRVERAFGHHRIEEGAAAAADFVLVHQVLEPLEIDGQVLLGGHRFGQLDQETVRLVQVERVVAGDFSRAGRAGLLDAFFEFRQPLLDDAEELLLFLFDHVGDRFFGLGDFGIGGLHRLHDGRDKFVQERLVPAERDSLPTGPAAGAAARRSFPSRSRAKRLRGCRR